MKNIELRIFHSPLSIFHCKLQKIGVIDEKDPFSFDRC
jgi:hypothetical protein